MNIAYVFARVMEGKTQPYFPDRFFKDSMWDVLLNDFKSHMPTKMTLLNKLIRDYDKNS